MPLGMELGLSPGDCVRWSHSPLPKRGRAPSQIFGPCLLWPNGWMDQDGTWHGGGPCSRPHCARWGTSSPPPKRGQSPPIFGPFLLSPNGWINQAGTWHGGGPWSKPHCARWGYSSPPPTRGQSSPKFSAHFYCRQTDGCIKMPLGMEIGLNPRYFVLDGDTACPPLKGHSPQFLSNLRCGQTTGWLKTPLGTEIDLGPGHIVLDGVPALRERGTATRHLFGPCLLWPRSPISASAELLCILLYRIVF